MTFTGTDQAGYYEKVQPYMTVEKAIEALQENAEYFSYDVPSTIFEQSVEDTMRALMSGGAEDHQQRTNEEWSKLVEEEGDPLEAVKLILDWINDKAQALIQ